MAYGAPKQPKPIASVQAGVGDLLSVVGGASGMLGYKDQYQIMMKEAKKWQSLAPKDTLGEFDAGDLLKPDFWTTKVPRTLPIMASLIPLAMGGYVAGAGVGAALGLGAFGTMVVGSLAGTLASRPIESLMEAGGTYNDALAQGMPESEAKKASQSTFIKNLAVGGFDIAELALSFAPTPFRMGNKFVKYLMVGGKIMAVGLQEGVEEAIQDVIQRQSLGQEVKIDPQMWEAATLGFIMGAGMGGAGGLMTSVQEGIQQSMPPNLKQKFDADKAQAIKEGLTEEKANEAALNKLAETPEGKTLIERIIAQVKEIAAGERGAIGKEKPKVPPAPEFTKQPWQMTKGEYTQYRISLDPKMQDAIEEGFKVDFNKEYADEVIKALKEGKPVPADIRAQYSQYAPSGITKPSESWRMTKGKFIGKATTQSAINYKAGVHERAVKQALSEGKPVPPEVLEDYPDLASLPQQAGMPEAGIQETMLPEEVSAKEVRPKGKGVVTQISMDEQLKLEKARGITGQKGIDAAVAEAKADITFNKDNPEGLQNAKAEIETELGNRSMPYHGGAKAGAYQGYTTKQLDAMLNTYNEVLPEAPQAIRKPVAEEVAPEQQVAQPVVAEVKQPPPTQPPAPPVVGGIDNPPPSIEPKPKAKNVIGIRTIEPGLTRQETLRNYLRGQFSRAYTKIGGHELVLEDALANPAMTERARLAPIIESLANDLGEQSQYAVNKAFKFDEKNRIPSLRGVVPEIGAPTIQDVAARLPLYQDSITGKQLKVLITIRNSLKPYHDLMTEEGIDIRSRGDVMNGGFYIPRSSATLEDVDMPYKVSGRGGGMKKGFEKPAIFDSQAQGIKAGYKYPPLGEALIGYVKGAGQRTTDAHIVNYFKALTDDTGKLLGETPKMRMLRQNPEVAKTVDEIKSNIIKLKSNVGALTQRQMGVIDLWANDPEFTDTSELIISLQEGLSTMKGGRPPQVLSELKALLKSNIDALKALKPSYDKAMRQAQVTPRDQGVITLPGLQGRTFPLAQANAVNIILKNEGYLTGKGAQVGRVVQSFNGLWAMTHATGDLSASAIQGLLMAYDNPIAWAKAFRLQAQSFFDKDVTGAFLADSDAAAVKAGRLTNAEWAKYGSHYFGASGFLEAISVSSKISDLPIIKQSNRAFGAFGDVARNLWRDNQLQAEMAKGKTIKQLEASGDLERIAFGANMMTGWAAKGAGGGIGDTLLFAPKWLQARLDVVGRAAAGLRPNAPVDQAMARNAFLKMIAFGTLLTVAINAALKQDTDFRPIVDGKRNGRFMRIQVGSGYFSLFGSWDSLLGAIINIGTGKPLNVLRSMGSGLVATAFDLITGRDYNYNVVGSKPINPIALMGWIARSSTPFAAGGMIESAGQMTTGEVIPGLINFGANILGVKSYVDKQSEEERPRLPSQPSQTEKQPFNPYK